MTTASSLSSLIKEKHSNVYAWLEGIFCGMDVPAFEVNERTLSILDELRCEVNRRDTSSKIAETDAKLHSEEYEVETFRLSQLLHSAGLSSERLSCSGAVSLKTLSGVALALNVDRPLLGSYTVAMHDVTTALYDWEEKLKNEASISACLIERTRSHLTRLHELSRALTKAQSVSNGNSSLLDKRLGETSILEKKRISYSRSVTEAKVNIQQSGFNFGLAHASLCAKSAEIKSVEGDLAPMRARLDSYQDLPPDLILARQRIEQARQQLDKLDATMADGIDLMHS